MIKTRKAQLVGESLTLVVVTLIVLALMLVFFFMIKGVGKGGADIKAMESFSLEESARFSLNAYASTPMKIEYGGENLTVTMVDLIRIAKINESYQKLLEDESNKIFDKVYGANNYRLVVKDVFSIGRVEYISNPTQPDIAIQKSQDSYTDEVSSVLEFSDIRITLSLKIK